MNITTTALSDGTIVIYDNESPDNVLCVIDGVILNEEEKKE